jgi:hypothetical protein
MATWKRLLTSGDVATGTGADGIVNDGNDLVTQDHVYEYVAQTITNLGAGSVNTVRFTMDSGSVSASNDATVEYNIFGGTGITTGTGTPQAGYNGAIKIDADIASTTAVGVASFSSSQFNVTGQGAVTVSNTVTFESGNQTLATNGGALNLDADGVLQLGFKSGEAIAFQTDGTTFAVMGYDQSDDILSLTVGQSEGNHFLLDNLGNGSIAGDWTVGGDLVVSGNTTTLNTEQLTVEDPLIQIGDTSVTNAVYESTLGGEGGIKLSVGTVNATPHYAQFIHDESESRLTGWKAKPSEASESTRNYASSPAQSQGNVMIMDVADLQSVPSASDNGAGIGTLVWVPQPGGAEFYIRTA